MRVLQILVPPSLRLGLLESPENYNGCEAWQRHSKALTPPVDWVYGLIGAVGLLLVAVSDLLES
jgi:hypothetical protein